jgi:hypothetical protein
MTAPQWIVVHIDAGTEPQGYSWIHVKKKWWESGFSHHFAHKDITTNARGTFPKAGPSRAE